VTAHRSEGFFEGAQQPPGGIDGGFRIFVPHHARDAFPLRGDSLFRIGDVLPGSFEVDTWHASSDHEMNVVSTQTSER